MADTDLAPNDSAATPTLPRFTTRAELIAWVEQKLAAARGDDAATFLVVLDLIRRVTLAHVDLKD